MRLFLFVFLWSIVGHAKTYDWRFIETPYGPAKDERVLKVDSAYALSEYNDNSSRPSFLSVDAEYFQSLNKDFALIWNPIPLGLLIHDSEQVGIDQSACRWSLGVAQGGFWGLKPQFNGSLRRALSETQAYEIELEYFSFFPFSDSVAVWTVGLKANYIAQLSKTFAVVVGGSTWVNDTVLLRTYDRTSSSNSSFQFTVPVHFGTDVRISENVHLLLDYEFRGIGLERDYRTHSFGFRPTIRW